MRCRGRRCGQQIYYCAYAFNQRIDGNHASGPLQSRGQLPEPIDPWDGHCRLSPAHELLDGCASSFTSFLASPGVDGRLPNSERRAPTGRVSRSALAHDHWPSHAQCACMRHASDGSGGPQAATTRAHARTHAARRTHAAAHAEGQARNISQN